jgi:hypothetical protein
LRFGIEAVGTTISKKKLPEKTAILSAGILETALSFVFPEAGCLALLSSFYARSRIASAKKSFNFYFDFS